MFRHVTAKLGNMKKPQQFTIYPRATNSPEDEVTIQSDKRIACVNLTTGKAMLSDGKGSHQGFIKLSPVLGAVEVDVPPEIVQQLKDMNVPSGPVQITVGGRMAI